MVDRTETEIKNSQGASKTKAQIKKERKEKAQSEARCLFCSKGFGWDIRDMEKINRGGVDTPTPQAFLICVNCLTGGDLPTNQDLKYIRQGWEKGGFLLTNIKVFPRAETLMMTLIEDGLKRGELKVFWEGGKVYMESKHGGITIELNIYRNTKEEGKNDSYFK